MGRHPSLYQQQQQETNIPEGKQEGMIWCDGGGSMPSVISRKGPWDGGDGDVRWRLAGVVAGAGQAKEWGVARSIDAKYYARLRFCRSTWDASTAAVADLTITSFAPGSSTSYVGILRASVLL